MCGSESPQYLQESIGRIHHGVCLGAMGTRPSSMLDMPKKFLCPSCPHPSCPAPFSVGSTETGTIAISSRGNRILSTGLMLTDRP